MAIADGGGVGLRSVRWSGTTGWVKPVLPSWALTLVYFGQNVPGYGLVVFLPKIVKPEQYANGVCHGVTLARSVQRGGADLLSGVQFSHC